MTKLLPFVFTTTLLCGCPETKVPKIPPYAPEPKLLMDEKKGQHSYVIPWAPGPHKDSAGKSSRD